MTLQLDMVDFSQLLDKEVSPIEHTGAEEQSQESRHGCGARLTRPQESLMCHSPLITFFRTSLLLTLTVDPHRTIEQAQIAHPIPNSRVKFRLAKLVSKVRDHQHLLLSYHCTQYSCPSGISAYGEIRDRHQSKTLVQDINPGHQPRTPVLDTCPRNRHHTSCMTSIHCHYTMIPRIHQ